MTNLEKSVTIIPYLTATQIAQRIEQLAAEIARDYQNKPLLIIALMRGSFIFTADLMRALAPYALELECDFLGLSSYHEGTETSGEVIITADITALIEGRHVLLLDDILESGLSLTCARGLMVERKAKSIKSAMLLEKPGKRRANIDADYVGFTIDDAFVVGYGLDFAGRYRELPYIGIVTHA